MSNLWGGQQVVLSLVRDEGIKLDKKAKRKGKPR
jgi:hypothetical protein